MIGDAKERVVEESRETILAQIRALIRDEIEVVMFPEGANFLPPVPNGIGVVVISDVPGAGTYFFNPELISEDKIRAEVAAGNHGRLLGHIESKDELKDGRPVVIVQAASPDGIPLQESAVHEDRVEEQVEVLKERHPEAKVEVVPYHAVVTERVMSRDLGFLKAFKEDKYRVGNCQAIEYKRNDHTIFKPGFLGELYFMLQRNRYNKRAGNGILEALFCGMKDLSYDAIVAYLATRAIVCLGVWVDETTFKLAGFAFPSTLIGENDERAIFGAYGFLPEFWGTDEQEILTALGLCFLFSELNLLSIHGIRYHENAQTAKFMERFGFRDVGTIPHYMLKRGKLVSAVVSTLSRERFEEVLAEMLGGNGSGQQDHRDKRKQGQVP